jgi:hypothetical protein
VAGIGRESGRWQRGTDSRFLPAVRASPLTGNSTAHEPALPTKGAKHPNNAGMRDKYVFLLTDFECCDAALGVAIM